MRATCSNMEDQNTTLLKRCEKLEGRNEELRDAYNSIGSEIISAFRGIIVCLETRSLHSYVFDSPVPSS